MGISRLPVCPECLASAEPIHAEFSCASCRTPFLSAYPLDERGLCALCRMGLEGYDAVYAYGSFEGPLRQLIHLLKFQGVKPLARPLGKLAMSALPREQQFDQIVPMPLHWRRRWKRGFNQAELLAREVARCWGVPVRNAVRRRKFTTPQTGLTNAKRRANVTGAFAVRRGTHLDGARILLVDDVITTGATASACAAALKRAGAAHVTVLALARTDRRTVLSFLEDRRSALKAAAAGVAV